MSQESHRSTDRNPGFASPDVPAVSRRSRDPRPLPPKVLHPPHPERICWGCDKYCPADDLRCGNGTVRTQHPAELLGEDWDE